MPLASSDHALFIRQLTSLIDLSRDDRAALATLPLKVRNLAERRDILREGSRAVEACIVLEGMVCRYKMLSNGRRQIVSFHIPGDMPSLQSLHLDAMDYSLASITPARVALVPQEAVRAIMKAHDGVWTALARHADVDGSIVREWMASIGRRTALERVGHLICELFVRLRACGLATLRDFELPLTQSELGDATGLSNVHVNRTLKELRRLGLIETNAKVHGILDWPQLQEVSSFDPAYLHLKRATPA